MRGIFLIHDYSIKSNTSLCNFLDTIYKWANVECKNKFL